MAQLQTACPYELKLLWVTDGDPEEEQSIHESLKHENIRGEWFRPGKDVLNTIYNSFNEFVIKLNNNESLTIHESYKSKICISSQLGEIALDLDENSFKINPVREKPEVLINKWWTRVVI